MKITIVNTLYYPNKIGGAEKSIQSLAEQFSLLENEVLVITLEKKNITHELNGVSIKALEIKNNYWPFDNKKRKTFEKILWHVNDCNNSKYDKFINKILIDFKPHILLTNNLTGFSTKIWGVAKNLNIKIVHVLRDYYLQCPKTTKFKNELNCESICFDCKLLSLNKKKNTQQINYLIGISKYIIKDHTKQGYFENVPKKHIYNGFDLNKRYEYTYKKSQEVVFGFIGQIKKSKGIELLLKALLNLKHDNWKLIIAGNIKKNYLESLERINKSKNIVFLGYTESDSFFKKIDVLIVPSLWNEPFGRVLIESLINRKPVIASNVGGISEILSNNKSFLVEPSLINFSSIIEKIICNPEILNRFVFDKAFIENFSIEKTTKEYLNVFKEVLKN